MAGRVASLNVSTAARSSCSSAAARARSGRLPGACPDRSSTGSRRNCRPRSSEPAEARPAPVARGGRTLYSRAADRPHAGVAQLVEQLICNQQVAGSSPIASSTLRVSVSSRWAHADDERSEGRVSGRSIGRRGRDRRTIERAKLRAWCARARADVRRTQRALDDAMSAHGADARRAGVAVSAVARRRPAAQRRGTEAVKRGRL